MSPTHRHIAALVVGASLAAPCIGAFAASQLYKCVDGGRTVYQQQACSPSAQAEVAASAPHGAAKASAPAADAGSATGPRKLRASSLPASSALATRR